MQLKQTNGCYILKIKLKLKTSDLILFVLCSHIFIGFFFGGGCGMGAYHCKKNTYKHPKQTKQVPFWLVCSMSSSEFHTNQF